MRAKIFVVGICLYAIVMTKIISLAQPEPDIDVISARPLRSHFTGTEWNTEYLDEQGHTWIMLQDERPELRDYILVIDRNNTSGFYDDDVVENVI